MTLHSPSRRIVAMNWMQGVVQNLLPLSEEDADVKAALAEWQYTGYTHDLEEAYEDCRLCGYSPIRYQFEIENHHNANTLLVGSECITRFQITGLDEYGDPLDVEETRKKVTRDRQKLIAAKLLAVLEEKGPNDYPVGFDENGNKVEWLPEAHAGCRIYNHG
jgi:hypothetical protein